MEADDAGTGLGEVRDDPVNRLHHQVHVDRRGHPVPAQRTAHQRPDGEVGYVMVVHHVEVDPVGAGGQHRIDFGAQAGEIRRKYGRCNHTVAHGRVQWEGERARAASRCHDSRPRPAAFHPATRVDVTEPGATARFAAATVRGAGA